MARNALIQKELIAFDGTRFQVLELPNSPIYLDDKPLLSTPEMEEHDPATIRTLILDGLGKAQNKT
jgi:hypothetical protein